MPIITLVVLSGFKWCARDTIGPASGARSADCLDGQLICHITRWESTGRLCDQAGLRLPGSKPGIQRLQMGFSEDLQATKVAARVTLIPCEHTGFRLMATLLMLMMPETSGPV